MNKKLILELKEELDKIEGTTTFMEVCGTHTMEIGKMSLRNFLGNKVKLISGPGCPVCVTPSLYIDYIYSLALNKNISIITYGDMLRVPGTSPLISLEKARALGGDIRLVYSSVDAIEIAKEEKNKNFVFLGIGFETTIPSTCVLLEEIINKGISNLFILSMHKRVEPVMEKLMKDKELKLDGFLCPGNVAVILGERAFEFIKEYGQLGVIAGFKEDEIIEAIIELIKNKGSKKIVNCYKSFVSREGNIVAKELINKYFKESQSLWRGLGNIDKSGLVLRDDYKEKDILNKFPLDEELKLITRSKEKYVCRCGEVLKGKILPCECSSFKRVCTPAFPIGPCMVSSEGTCAAYYKYEG